MLLKSILLQHFRNYTQQKFDFNDDMTIVVGPNTAGKTNLSEAMYLLSTGKSFKTSTDTDMIAFGQEVGRAQALLGISNTPNVIPAKAGIQENKEWIPDQVRDDNVKVEVTIASPLVTGGRFSKK
ncbi:MAG TPA: AAA family ATPase, partial [Candidatus Eisenbacteria bacterium]|nr:AAA family ATPase [Candidatus Eisenbacteria bacterium]